jgi:glycosyltransferase involved in cell wall biosynthesis
MKRRRILVPRLLDAAQFNAQNLNAKAILSRVNSEEIKWLATHYDAPDPTVRDNAHVELVKLWRWRFWKLRMFLFYLQTADALFYPGVELVDSTGWRWRKRLYPDIPIIATLEGLGGTEERERQLSEWAGHPVYCQRVSQETMERLDDCLHKADHVVAISPFLARMGKHLYGDKFSVIPLGIDQSLFYTHGIARRARPRVVSAGRVEQHKRPELFLDLAAANPQADFIWLGEGSGRNTLQVEAATRDLENIDFVGLLPEHRLAEVFRTSDLFVMPSKSEGVPKVTQEAAACGLPLVIFGYYEAPTVIDGKNGFVVWDDETFFSRVSELIASPDLRVTMREHSIAMARNWSWDVLAPQWLAKIRDILPVR